MPERIIIVAQAENRVIGCDNAMPWHLPRDLRFFKEQTRGHPVIMGRKTYESLGRALPQRENIVISRQPLTFDDAHHCASLEEALALAASYDDTIFIIGGAQIYAEALESEQVDTLLVTQVHTQIDGDRFFPPIDEKKWRQVSAEHVEADDNNAYAMTFCRYRKVRA